MPWWVWIAIVGGAVVVFAVVVWRGLASRRSSVLRERFGPEYDRTVKSVGSRRKAEAELVERQERHGTLQLVPLSFEAQQRYRTQWEAVQARFREAAMPAVAAAEALIVSVMSDRGYPMLDGFERRLADASVDYPDAVGEYRQAHDLYRRSDQGKTKPDDLRRAMQHYHSFVERLLQNDLGAPAGGELDNAGLEKGSPPKTEHAADAGQGT